VWSINSGGVSIIRAQSRYILFISWMNFVEASHKTRQIHQAAELAQKKSARRVPQNLQVDYALSKHAPAKINLSRA
jgi:hypothetical protein